MITMEVAHLQNHIAASEKLSVGYDFMQLIRSEGLVDVTTGLFPAICGGAVRNGLFLNTPINDVDIFLFKSSSGDRRVQLSTQRDLDQIRDNILSWLEDEGIESQSLLSSNYMGNQTFTDIIQFVWRNVTIQVMIPGVTSASQSIDNLLRTLPIYSSVVLTLEYLRMFNITVAQYYLPEHVYYVGSDRDISYLRNKDPNSTVIPIANAGDAIGPALSQFVNTLPLGNVNLSDAELIRSNTAMSLVKRAFCHKLGVVSTQFTTSPSTPNHSL